jgi:ADP-heptose:LPS heptosyltransferase
MGVEITLREVLPALAGAPVRGGGLLICPAAGDGIREYPAPRIQEVVRLFSQRVPGMRITVCLPPGPVGRRWQDALDGCHGGSIEWLHPASIETLITTIACADLVLAPDSAPAHLATALDIPGVFLLGGGHFGMFAPWGQSGRQTWLWHETDCYHCQWHCRHPEAYCLTHIPPQAVAQALCAASGCGLDS